MHRYTFRLEEVISEFGGNDIEICVYKWRGNIFFTTLFKVYRLRYIASKNSCSFFWKHYYICFDFFFVNKLWVFLYYQSELFKIPKKDQGYRSINWLNTPRVSMRWVMSWWDELWSRLFQISNIYFWFKIFYDGWFKKKPKPSKKIGLQVALELTIIELQGK